MNSIPLEDLTSAQLIQRYQELNMRHQQLDAEFSDFKSKAAQEKSDVEKAHAETVRNLKAQYAQLEQELEKFKTLHAKNPEIFLSDYEHHNGLYVRKTHPQWGYFCGGCLAKGIAAQMRECDAGWQCNVCPHFIYKPGF